ncbi:S-methyl-5'-thioadenosine phosphorylase [Galemys pyrenaicus]|uniref:S-methyl-5'-thioadenosine phosphorylase n=1 Tax=Galemys pyrenaicus TaxID=202257 RepID=A0A8J6DFA0_GALPY|nr:S-methyl-5'-thioadenosine phosphorylase [Galemys pyrenaicus]
MLQDPGSLGSHMSRVRRPFNLLCLPELLVEPELKIGIIGGTGLDDPEILEGRTEKYVDTPFGKPSDALILGKIKNVDCVLLARHGRHHTIMPSNVNYQANIWALKEEGCTHIIVTTACGSLREEIQPGDIIIIDQFIDRTDKRSQTFYDGSHPCARGVCHIPMAEPFCPKTREVLIETTKKLGLRCHPRGTMVTIEGPRFSSRAESFMFRIWGADVINMTTVPEVVLAKEAGICYASIAMATDYDCWKEHEEAVSVDRVLKTLKENANKAKSLLLTTIPQIGSMEWSETLHNMKSHQVFINVCRYRHKAHCLDADSSSSSSSSSSRCPDLAKRPRPGLAVPAGPPCGSRGLRDVSVSVCKTNTESLTHTTPCISTYHVYRLTHKVHSRCSLGTRQFPYL